MENKPQEIVQSMIDKTGDKGLLIAVGGIALCAIAVTSLAVALVRKR